MWIIVVSNGCRIAYKNAGRIASGIVGMNAHRIGIGITYRISFRIIGLIDTMIYFKINHNRS